MKTFDEINEMVWGFQKARLLLTAVELDVFTAVGDGKTAMEVADSCRSDCRATEMLLNALVAESFLEKTGSTFRNTALSNEYLVKESPQDGRAALLHHAGLWHAWSQLTGCVQSGQKADVPCRDDLANRAFIGAMHVYATQQASYFVDAVDLSGIQSLLDLGGGSGAYSITFCRANPNLCATVFDRPEILSITREYIEEAGLSDMVLLRDGDLLTDDLGGPYDVVWVSNVVHAYGPENVQLTFARVFEALCPGGRMVFRDFIMDQDKTQPAFGALFALNMLVATGEGGSYSLQEYANWMTDAGFSEPNLITVEHPGSTRMLVAKKPEVEP